MRCNEGIGRARRKTACPLCVRFKCELRVCLSCEYGAGASVCGASAAVCAVVSAVSEWRSRATATGWSAVSSAGCGIMRQVAGMAASGAACLALCARVGAEAAAGAATFWATVGRCVGLGASCCLTTDATCCAACWVSGSFGCSSKATVRHAAAETAVLTNQGRR